MQIPSISQFRQRVFRDGPLCALLGIQRTYCKEEEYLGLSRRLQSNLSLNSDLRDQTRGSLLGGMTRYSLHCLDLHERSATTQANTWLFPPVFPHTRLAQKRVKLVNCMVCIVARMQGPGEARGQHASSHTADLVRAPDTPRLRASSPRFTNTFPPVV